MALRDNLREKWFKNNSRSYKDRDVRYGYGQKNKWQPTNMNDQNGKGSTQRNKNISSVEEDLRWKLAFGKISEQEFNEAMEKLNGEEDN
jgi:hypothetical protein